MNSDQVNAIKNVISLFDEAENRVKEVEQLAEGLSVPSINELRYCGYHLARAFSEDNPEDLSVQVEKASSHCKRAIYDAHEIGIMYILAEIKSFKESYTPYSSVVMSIVPTYIEELSLAEEASNFISDVNENNSDRDTYYKDCQPYYKSLKGVFDKFQMAEPLINKEIEEQRKSAKMQTRRFITQMSLTLLAIIISVVVGGTLIYLKMNGSS